MVIECNWYGWMDMSNTCICLATGIASVITTMCAMSCIWVTKLILHLIAKSLALVDVMFIVWWIILAIMSCLLQICETEVVMLFLILVLEITRTVF